MEICSRDRSFFVARVGRKKLWQDNFFLQRPFPPPGPEKCQLAPPRLIRDLTPPPLLTPFILKCL